MSNICREVIFKVEDKGVEFMFYNDETYIYVDSKVPGPLMSYKFEKNELYFKSTSEGDDYWTRWNHDTRRDKVINGLCSWNLEKELFGSER